MVKLEQSSAALERLQRVETDVLLPCLYILAIGYNKTVSFFFFL
jgi:hypothetical protein